MLLLLFTAGDVNGLRCNANITYKRGLFFLARVLSCCSINFNSCAGRSIAFFSYFYLNLAFLWVFFFLPCFHLPSTIRSCCSNCLDAAYKNSRVIAGLSCPALPLYCWFCFEAFFAPGCYLLLLLLLLSCSSGGERDGLLKPPRGAGNTRQRMNT